MVELLKRERGRRVRNIEEWRRLLGEDWQDGGQISKVPVGNPAGEGSVFLPFSSVIAESILCPTVGEASFIVLRESHVFAVILPRRYPTH